MATRRLFSLACFSALLLLSPARAQQAREFAWNLEPGLEIRYVHKQSIATTVHLNPDVKLHLDQQMHYTWKVTEVTGDGTAKIRLTIDRVVARVAQPGLTVEFDSDRPQAAEPPNPRARAMFEGLRRLVGSTIEATMDRKGNVGRVEFSGELAELARQDGMLGGDILRQLARSSSLVFPNKPIAKGNRWSREIRLNVPFGTMTVSGYHRYLGTEASGDKPLHRFSFDAVVTIEPRENAPVQIEVADSKQKVDLYVDAAVTHVVRSKSELRMEQRITAQGRTLNQTVEVTQELLGTRVN